MNDDPTAYLGRLLALACAFAWWLVTVILSVWGLVEVAL